MSKIPGIFQRFLIFSLFSPKWRQSIAYLQQNPQNWIHKFRPFHSTFIRREWFQNGFTQYQSSALYDTKWSPIFCQKYLDVARDVSCHLSRPFCLRQHGESCREYRWCQNGQHQHCQKSVWTNDILLLFSTLWRRFPEK